MRLSIPRETANFSSRWNYFDGRREVLRFRTHMRTPLRLRAGRLIATLGAALVIGALQWSSLDLNTRHEPGGKVDGASLKRDEPSPAGAELAPSSVRNSARPKSANVAASKPDGLLENLRTKLEAKNVVRGEALLTFRSAEARERFTQNAAAHGLQILDNIPQLNTARVRYERVEDLRDSIASSDGDFANVEGNLWLSIPGTSAPTADPNNQGGRAPFGQATLNAINAGGDRTNWGERITVAVLDTGILAHPTFAEGQITHLDLVGDGQSFHSHGTSVASLIAGQHPQAPGVAPAAKILDLRVANAEGYSVGSTLAQGIIAAADRGAQVINISLGGYGDSAVLGQAVAYAFRKGAVVVAAAGNDTYGQLAIPAAYEGVISVGSVDANNRQAYFSNAGAGLDLAAPGVGVVSAWETDKVALVSGTSQSSALVSAAAASYLGWGVPANQIAARLKGDARPAPAAPAAGGVGILRIKPPVRR